MEKLSLNTKAAVVTVVDHLRTSQMPCTAEDIERATLIKVESIRNTLLSFSYITEENGVYRYAPKYAYQTVQEFLSALAMENKPVAMSSISTSHDDESEYFCAPSVVEKIDELVEKRQLCVIRHAKTNAILALYANVMDEDRMPQIFIEEFFNAKTPDDVDLENALCEAGIARGSTLKPVVSEKRPTKRQRRTRINITNKHLEGTDLDVKELIKRHKQ